MWLLVVCMYSGLLIRKRVMKKRMGEVFVEDLWMNVERRWW